MPCMRWCPIDWCEGEREASTRKLEIELLGLEFAHAVANSTWSRLRRGLECRRQDRWDTGGARSNT